MKVVHIIYSLGLGGIETMLRNIVNKQVNVVEHEIHLIVINNLVNKELFNSLDKRIHVHCIGRHIGSKNPVPYIRLNIMLRKIEPDVIHLHYSSIARFIFLPSLKKKLCVTQHDVCNKQNSNNLWRCKRIYAISNVVQDDILKWTGLKSEVVFNGIDVDAIKCRQRNTVNKIFRIVQVSRLMHEKKGQHILIKALDQLIKKGYNQISLDLIGEGESYKYLVDLVKELNMDHYVNFLGAKDQSYIYKHLCEYDLFVQPSIFEGFGLTVTEAMVAKIPVLVSANQGPMEIIDNGRYGYYFKNQDFKDCAAKIELFLKGNDDKSMIDKAYHRVVDLYNVELTAKAYLDKYKDFIGSGYAKRNLNG